MGQPLTRQPPAAIDRIGSDREGQGQTHAQIPPAVDPAFAAQGKARELVDITERILLSAPGRVIVKAQPQGRGLAQRGIGHDLRALKPGVIAIEPERRLPAQPDPPDLAVADQG